MTSVVSRKWRDVIRPYYYSSLSDCIFSYDSLGMSGMSGVEVDDSSGVGVLFPKRPVIIASAARKITAIQVSVLAVANCGAQDDPGRKCSMA